MTFELHRTQVVDPSVLTMEEEPPVRVRSREGELLSCTPKAARSAGTLRHMIDIRLLHAAGGATSTVVVLARKGTVPKQWLLEGSGGRLRRLTPRSMEVYPSCECRIQAHEAPENTLRAKPIRFFSPC